MTAPDTQPQDLRVTTATEILTFLQQLQREHAALQLSGPQGQNLGARIVALDAAADVIGLALGADPEGVSQSLVSEGEITVVGYLGSIKLQFELDAPVLVSGDLGTVLRSPLPERMYRFQRRQSFRVQPAGSTYPRVVLPAGPAGATAPGRTLRVLDISIGGLALVAPPDFGTLQPGDDPTGVTLELDRMSALRLTLRPHHASPIRGDSAGMLQIGCEFVEPEADAQRALQVYVDQTQKRRRLLKLDA